MPKPLWTYLIALLHFTKVSTCSAIAEIVGLWGATEQGSQLRSRRFGFVEPIYCADMNPEGLGDLCTRRLNQSKVFAFWSV